MAAARLKSEWVSPSGRLWRCVYYNGHHLLFFFHPDNDLVRVGTTWRSTVIIMEVRNKTANERVILPLVEGRRGTSSVRWLARGSVRSILSDGVFHFDCGARPAGRPTEQAKKNATLHSGAHDSARFCEQITSPQQEPLRSLQICVRLCYELRKGFNNHFVNLALWWWPDQPPWHRCLSQWPYSNYPGILRSAKFGREYVSVCLMLFPPFVTSSRPRIRETRSRSPTRMNISYVLRLHFSRFPSGNGMGICSSHSKIWR